MNNVEINLHVHVIRVILMNQSSYTPRSESHGVNSAVREGSPPSGDVFGCHQWQRTVRVFVGAITIWFPFWPGRTRCDGMFTHLRDLAIENIKTRNGPSWNMWKQTSILRPLTSRRINFHFQSQNTKHLFQLEQTVPIVFTQTNYFRHSKFVRAFSQRFTVSTVTFA